MICRLLMLIVAGSLVVAAQTQTTPALAFEVASVRPVSDPNVGGGGGFPPGRFFMSRTTLETLVRMAYEIPGYRVVNAGPAWVGSEEFAIDARAANVGGKPAPQAQVRQMLQTLLADRFKLVIRRETRNLPTYSLVFARADRRMGSQLRRSQIDCSTPEGRSRALAVMEKGRTPCGTTMGPTPNGLMSFTADGVQFPQLPALAAFVLGRDVSDGTGLSGLFDWELRWAAEPDIDGPAFLTAVEEQLGLKLEAGRGPVDVIVIEAADRPNPN